MKEKKPKSDNEYEISKPIDEGSMKKVKKKGRTSKCSYCIQGFHPENKFQDEYGQHVSTTWEA